MSRTMKRLISCAPAPCISAPCMLALCLAACAAPNAGRRPTASPGEVGAALNAYGQATVPVGGLVAFQGDDLFYGPSIKRGRPGINGSSTPRSATPIPETVFRVLGRRVSAQIRAFPGDTIEAGVKRWAGRPPVNLLIVSYAYGDAKAKTPLATYKAALEALIASTKAAGGAVILVVPPSSANAALDGQLEPYRAVIRSLRQTGTSVLEANDALNSIKEPRVRTPAQRDQGYRAIAGAIVPYIRIAPGP